ncbi:MAG TPA: Fe-S cluster assembly protein SufD [Micropepsaceae bacterium]|nr:Fe-S cluster assembly protein SufD [Micropepsaceae bacterium]
MTALAFKRDTTPNLFAQDFAQNRSVFPGAGLAWLEARRSAAMDAFAKTGVPTRRVEAWKYTDLANALEADAIPAARFHGSLDADNPFAIAGGAELLLVNGFLQRSIGAKGIEIVDLGGLDSNTPDWVKENLGLMAAGAAQPLGAASLALMRGGAALRVRGHETVRLHFANPASDHDTVSHARVLIVAEAGASLRLFESHSSEGESQSLANLGMELVLKSGAKMEHIRVQTGAANALHVTSLGASLAKDAEYRALYAAMGGRLSRLDIDVKLGSAGAHATLHNVAVLNAGIADVTTVMDHAAAHTTSRQLFKSVVGGRGRSVNQGRVSVRKGAVKSDSHQLFKALLLSPRAEADAKPELEIFADDVVCGHGTAIGALDADALFYLRARGIPELEAKGLLIRAFLADALEGFGDEALRDALSVRLDAALGALEEATP